MDLEQLELNCSNSRTREVTIKVWDLRRLRTKIRAWQSILCGLQDAIDTETKDAVAHILMMDMYEVYFTDDPDDHKALDCFKILAEDDDKYGDK